LNLLTSGISAPVRWLTGGMSHKKLSILIKKQHAEGFMFYALHGTLRSRLHRPAPLLPFPENCVAQMTLFLESHRAHTSGKASF
jgi:hypothetical protein